MTRGFALGVATLGLTPDIAARTVLANPRRMVSLPMVKLSNF